jgi:hypothetical protein
MSISIINLVYKNENLSGIEKAVLLRMAWHANDEGKNIFPSVGNISNAIGFCRKAVSNTIQALIKKGFLIRLTLPNYGSSHNYVIDMITLTSQKIKSNLKVIHRRAVDKFKGVGMRYLGGWASRTQGVGMRGTLTIINRYFKGNNTVGKPKSVDNSWFKRRSLPSPVGIENLDERKIDMWIRSFKAKICKIEDIHPLYRQEVINRLAA